MTLLEVPRQKGEPGEETEEVGEDDPFVSQVRQKAERSRAGSEAGEKDLVQRDRGQPGEGDTQGVMMKQRDPHEKEPEEDEIDRDPEEERDRGDSGAPLSDHERERGGHFCPTKTWLPGQNSVARPSARTICVTVSSKFTSSLGNQIALKNGEPGIKGQARGFHGKLLLC